MFKLPSDNNFKIMEFFSIFNFTALIIMRRLFKKYCSSFWHQKPGKFTV